MKIYSILTLVALVLLLVVGGYDYGQSQQDIVAANQYYSAGQTAWNNGEYQSSASDYYTVSTDDYSGVNDAQNAAGMEFWAVLVGLALSITVLVKTQKE